MSLDPLSVGISGSNAAAVRLGNSAHNLANMLTQDFHSRRTHQVERSGGGVDALTGVDPEPGVNVAREFVDQAASKFQSEASVRVINADLQLKGTILDILA